MNLQLSITLGDLIQLGGVVVSITAVYYAIKGRIRELELTLGIHAKDLATHANRMAKYEESMVSVIGNVQRIIGRMEMPERRTHGRG